MADLRTALSLLAACGVAAALPAQDIGSDGMAPPSALVFPAAVFGDPARRLAEAHTQYACGLLALHEDGRLSERAEAHLLAALANDPTAVEVVKLLFAGWSEPDGLQASRIIDKLFPIAAANPRAWPLNATVANALLQNGHEREATVLIEAALREVEEDPAAAVADRGGGVDIITMAASLYGMLERYDDGEKLFRRKMRRKEFAANFAVRRAATVFFSLQADQGGDGWWLFPSRKQRFRRALDENFAAAANLWREMARTAWEQRRPLAIAEIGSLLQVCARYGWADQGDNLIGEALLNNPGDIRAIFVLATFYAEGERYGEATRLWRRIAAEKPDEPDFHLELGRMALLARWYDEAVRALDAYLLLQPGENAALYQAGIAYYEMGKSDKAIYTLAKTDDMPEAHYLIALAHRRESRYAEALAAAEEAEKLAKKLEQDDFLSRDFYLTFAYLCERAKNIPRASEMLERLHQEDPEDAEVANFLGYLWADHNQRLDEAERLIRVALAKDPENAAYLDSLAWAFYRQGRFKEAAREIERALEHEGAMPSAVIADHAGDIYRDLGDVSRALHFWRLALERHDEELDHAAVREKVARHESGQ